MVRFKACHGYAKSADLRIFVHRISADRVTVDRILPGTTRTDACPDTGYPWVTRSILVYDPIVFTLLGLPLLMYLSI